MAIDFDGTGDWIDFGDVLDMGTNDWTMMCWMKTTAGFGFIIAKSGFFGGTMPDGWFMNNSTGPSRLGAGIRKNGTGEVVETADGATIDDDVWHHVAVTFDRSGNMTRFVDGVATGTADDISSLDGENLSSTEELRIAARDAAGEQEYTGKIADVRVYSRVLTVNEILTIFTLHGKDRIVFGLLDRFLLNEKEDAAAATGANSVKGIGSQTNDGTPAGNPVYTDDAEFSFGKMVA